MSTPTQAEWMAAFDALLEVASDMRPYVPEYFAEKWAHDKSLDAARSFRAALGSEEP